MLIEDFNLWFDEEKENLDFCDLQWNELAGWSKEKYTQLLYKAFKAGRYNH